MKGWQQSNCAQVLLLQWAVKCWEVQEGKGACHVAVDAVCTVAGQAHAKREYPGGCGFTDLRTLSGRRGEPVF